MNNEETNFAEIVREYTESSAKAELHRQKLRKARETYVATQKMCEERIGRIDVILNGTSAPSRKATTKVTPARASAPVTDVTHTVSEAVAQKHAPTVFGAVNPNSMLFGLIRQMRSLPSGLSHSRVELTEIMRCHGFPGITVDQTSTSLSKLAKAGHIVAASKGKWSITEKGVKYCDANETRA